MKIAGIYARVSGERQRDDNTIASQTEALIAYAEDHGYSVAPDMIIEDDGYTGTVLERPGLERVRDLTAATRCLAHRHRRVPARSPITAAWVPTPGATSTDRCATVDRCARTC